MSTQAEVDYVNEELSEQSVHDYLALHPDFFEGHANLLSSLNLPHTTGGTVSLVERQVSVLRQNDLSLQKQLKELIEVARANDLLSAKIHELTMQLFAASDLKTMIITLEEGMRSGFGADQVVLVVFGDPDAFHDIDTGKFFRVTDKDDDALSPFNAFLAGKAARCGKIHDAQRDFLFQEDANDIGSSALVPLGIDNEIGFLAIGSADANHFHPGMSVDFLTRLGDLLAGALKRY
ncbi:MAG: DUF484 family protein [Gammaproteobacteria bacterium]|jgi:uncharacterized protein|nr:DUF484 family protein [Gammaproteobacteria bacterium]